MSDFIDTEKEKMKEEYSGFISPDTYKTLLALNVACFFEVDRYRHTKKMSEFETMSSVRYSDVLQDSKFKRMTERLTDQMQQYDKSELTYLTIRHLIHYSWKLDALFLAHLRECIAVNERWRQILLSFSMQNQLFFEQPYWLRNAQLLFLQNVDSDFRPILNKIEFVMVKSNMIFPKYASFGKEDNLHYFIQMDSGIYHFLYDWILIILSGYRMKQFDSGSGYMRLTQPVRSAATLLLLVASIIRGESSALDLPNMVFNYSPNDNYIAKDIVTNQINFLIGHECGHINAAGKHIKMNDQEEELYADDFSLEYINEINVPVVILNSKQEIFCNDIQAESVINRMIEDTELLFLFYDMYYYASSILGYKIADDNSHPHSSVRRNVLRQKYPADKQTKLLEYAEEFSMKVKEEMKKYERNKL